MSFFKKKTQNLGIIFDIGGSSVRAGLVRFDENKVPHIIYTAREAIAFQQIVNPTRLFTMMLETLKIISLKVLRDGVLHLKFTKYGGLEIKNIFYIFSSPWSVSESKVITIQKEKPFDITESYIKSLVEQQEKVFEEMYAVNQNNSKGALITVDKQITQIKLNGYETPNPYNMKASRIDVSFFLSIVPKDVMDKVEEIDVHGGSFRSKKSFSLSLIAYSTIRDLFKKEDDFIFLDITSNMTDLTVVRDGVVIENASFPLGKDFIVNNLAKVLSSPYDVTRSTLRSYFEGQVDDATKAIIKPVVEDARKKWFISFQESLKGVAVKSYIPKTIFLIVSNTFKTFFPQSIQEDKFNQFTGDGVGFKVVVLDSETLKDHVHFSGSIYKDPFIALESIYIGKYLSL